MLDALNLSSDASYTRGTQSTAVERDGEVVSVIPYRNKGLREGFAAALDETIRLDRPVPAQLAEAVVHTLAPVP